MVHACSGHMLATKIQCKTAHIRSGRTVKIQIDVMKKIWKWHYIHIIMGTVAFQITSLTIVYSTVYSGADQIKPQSSASLAFLKVIHRWPEHKGLVTRKMFPFDDVIMRVMTGLLNRLNSEFNHNVNNTETRSRLKEMYCLLLMRWQAVLKFVFGRNKIYSYCGTNSTFYNKPNVFFTRQLTLFMVEQTMIIHYPTHPCDTPVAVMAPLHVGHLAGCQGNWHTVSAVISFLVWN